MVSVVKFHTVLTGFYTQMQICFKMSDFSLFFSPNRFHQLDHKIGIWFSYLLEQSLEKLTLEIEIQHQNHHYSLSQPAKLDLNKKSFPKQKTIQNFIIEAQGFRKTKNENPPTWEIEVTS